VLDQTLKPGQQIAQCAHAIADFSKEHPEIFREWHEQSNYICCLVAEDLRELAWRCREQDINCTLIHEPDYDDQLTAIAIEPTQLAKKIVRPYKLAPG
jgi:peptidyl-tRNA hydrolase